MVFPFRISVVRNSGLQISNRLTDSFFVLFNGIPPSLDDFIEEGREGFPPLLGFFEEPFLDGGSDAHGNYLRSSFSHFHPPSSCFASSNSFCLLLATSITYTIFAAS